MFDIVLDTLMLPIEREVAADIRKRLSSLSWRPNQIAVIRTERTIDARKADPMKPPPSNAVAISPAQVNQHAFLFLIIFFTIIKPLSSLNSHATKST